MPLVNAALLANGATISSSYDRGSTFQPLEYMFEDSPGHSEYGKWGYTNTHADWENEPIDLEIQLNGTYQISEIVLQGAGLGGFPAGFKLEAKVADGWKDVDTWSDVQNCGYGETQTFTFDTVTCTAIKMTTTKNRAINDGTYGVCLTDFKVYGIQVPDVESGTVQTYGTPFSSSVTTVAPTFQLSNLNDGVAEGANYYSSGLFATNEGGEYAGVLFDDAYEFSSVTLSFIGADTMPEAFRVQVYDGTAWQNVFTKTADDGQTINTEHVIALEEAIAGTAVKLIADKMRICDAGNQTYGLQLREMIIEGTKSDEVLEQPAVNLYNASNGMSVSYGTNTDGFTGYSEWEDPNNLVDNISWSQYSSKWSSYAYNYEWVQVTFDAPVKAQQVTFGTWSADWNGDGTAETCFPKDFRIDVYTGTEWQTVVSMTDYAKSCYKFCFAPVECSAIRLVATELDHADSASNYALILKEMEVYADNAGQTVTRPKIVPERKNRTAAAVALSHGVNNGALNDVEPNNETYYYTSQLVENATGEVSIQFMFERPIYTNQIRMLGHDAGKFPSAFNVYAFTGDKWENVLSVTDYTFSETAKEHNFAFEDVYCSSIMFVTNDLYAIGDVYGIRLNEVYIYSAFEDGACALLGDGNDDKRLTDTEDGNALRTHIVSGDVSDAKYDLNRDDTNDIVDLVRLKRYFAEN